MQLVYILIGLIVLGFGAIAFILINEKKKETPAAAPSSSASSAGKKPEIAPEDLLNRLGLQGATPDKPSLIGLLKKSQPQETPGPLHLPEDPLKKPSPMTMNPAQTAADTKAVSELSLKYDELMTEHKELQEKFAKLEVLFAEKSMNLEKTDKALNTELKNQKDFNKIKDVLEKELKDAKDKAKSLQNDVTAAQSETQNYLNRVGQLEEKVKRLEIEVLTSEAAINDAQAGTQLARKHAAELEEKLRAQDNVILEKNKKIEDLVARLNIHPTENTLPPPKEEIQIAEATQSETTPSNAPRTEEQPKEEPPLETTSHQEKQAVLNEPELLKTDPPVEEPALPAAAKDNDVAPIAQESAETISTPQHEPEKPAAEPAPETLSPEENAPQNSDINNNTSDPADTPDEEKGDGPAETLSLPPDIFAKGAPEEHPEINQPDEEKKEKPDGPKP